MQQLGGAPVLTRGDRVVHLALSALWVLVTVRFWVWWLQPEHRGAPALQIPAAIALAYLTTGLPTFYWFFVGRMRRPEHRPAPPGLRVAMITPCVPSHESLEVIEDQLRALVAVDYPHDSWILDEGGLEAIRALADRYGARYFTRKDVERFNQPGPPFMAKTKAGNVNAWLDLHGDDYDVFVQMDIDHHPVPGYLDRTLGHFEDPVVAWVQAPSVSGNLHVWTSRGLAEQDLVLQGPLQMGFYGHSGTPFIIGSHTSYRMSALQEIGGFQPTRAEDHLDTVVLAAHGYRGVYVPEVIATGDGPEDFGTYLGQQFAWAYSMIQIFLEHTPRLLRRYTRSQAFQFLMAQSWYTLWSLSLAVLWTLPLLALILDEPIASVQLSEFLVYYVALLATSSLMWWTSRSFFQPHGVHLSWRSIVLETARWPVVLWAVLNVLLRIERPYMITPKGHQNRVQSAWRLYGSYGVLAVLSLGTALLVDPVSGPGHAGGHVVLVLFDAAMAMTMLVTTLGLELRDLRGDLGVAGMLRMRSGSITAMAALLGLSAATVSHVWEPLSRAVT